MVDFLHRGLLNPPSGAGMSLGVLSRRTEGVALSFAIADSPDPANTNATITWAVTLTVDGQHTNVAITVAMDDTTSNTIRPTNGTMNGWGGGWPTSEPAETPDPREATFTKAAVSPGDLGFTFTGSRSAACTITATLSAGSSDQVPDAVEGAAASTTVQATWTVDATSGDATPLTEAEAEAWFAAGGVSSPSAIHLYKFGSVVSGNVPDVIGLKTLTVSGTWLNEQAVTGWSIKSMRSTTGTAARALNTTFSNVNATSYTIFLLARPTSLDLGSTKTLYRVGNNFDDDATAEFSSTPRTQVGEGDGTRTVGTVNPTNTAQWYVLRVDDTANTVDLFTVDEKLIGGTQACNGTELCVGGDNVQTWFPGTVDYMLMIVAAGAFTNTQIESILQQGGQDPPWSP